MKHAIRTLLSTARLEIRHSSTLDRFLLKFDQVNTKTFLYLGRMLGLITHLDGGVVECGVGERSVPDAGIFFKRRQGSLAVGF